MTTVHLTNHLEIDAYVGLLYDIVERVNFKLK